MRDIDVRIALWGRITNQFAEDEGTLVLDEFVVGAVRADMAVVNGALHGYEIKSDADTLERLPSQARTYSKVFDHVTIVVGRKHLNDAVALVPDWWGVVEASEYAGTVDLRSSREPGANPAVEPIELAWLLWRDELISALDSIAIQKGTRHKTRGQLAELLAAALPLNELKMQVRRRLRQRTRWRSDALRM